MGIIDLEKGHPMAKNLIDAYENPSLQTDYDTDSRIRFKKSISHLSIKEQRKVLDKQVKAVEKRIKDIEKSKSQIRKTMI